MRERYGTSADRELTIQASASAASQNGLKRRGARVYDRNHLRSLASYIFMKTSPCALIRIVSAGILAAMLMLAPVRPAHAQATSGGATTANASSGAEASHPTETGSTSTHHKGAHTHPQAKKKKPSFMHRMRDKAMGKFQKYFSKKNQSEPKQAPKHIPEKDIE
jgi:hypothetical protein